MDIFEGTEQIQQLVISRAISGLRIEWPLTRANTLRVTARAGCSPPRCSPSALLRSPVVGASRQQVAKHGTLTWLTDIAGLSRDAAIELMRWSAGAMLEAAVANWRAVDASPTL